jgi:hypothetical protein
MWNFSRTSRPPESAAAVTSRQAAERQVASSQGYDLPPYTKFNDFKTWKENGPPVGTLSHYPIRVAIKEHHRLLAGTAAGGRPDLDPGDHAENDRAPLPEPMEDPLGRERAGRLQAHVTLAGDEISERHADAGSVRVTRLFSARRIGNSSIAQSTCRVSGEAPVVARFGCAIPSRCTDADATSTDSLTEIRTRLPKFVALAPQEAQITWILYGIICS